MNQVLAKIEADNLKKIAALRHNPEFTNKPISISRIQWHLKMGYNMSAHLLANAINDGILTKIDSTPHAGLFSQNGCFHKNCHDCEAFVKKDEWVDKADTHKCYALCVKCLSEYDSSLCY